MHAMLEKNVTKMNLLQYFLFELLKLSISHIPFPRHFDGMGPYPWSLKLCDSGHTPIQEEKCICLSNCQRK